MSTETDAVGESTDSRSTSSRIHLGSILTVAKKDFQDAVRSWLFWGLSVLFFLLLVGIAGALSYFGEDIAAQGATTDALVFFVSQVTKWIVPLIALILAEIYKNQRLSAGRK